MSTTVVNIRTLPRNPKDWPADHVYVGRANRRHWLECSDWHNPFPLSGPYTRTQSIAAFEQYIAGRTRLLERLPELRGKVLVCWCKPLACHGDVLAEMADEVAT